MALLPALAFLLLAVLQPPEIHPHVRAAFGLLVPLSLLSCLAAGRRAAARFEAAGPFLAGCAGFLAINGYLALQQHGAVVAAERLALAAAAFLVFRELADEPSLIAGRRLDGRTCVFLALAAAGCAASLVALWQWTYGFQMMAEAVPQALSAIPLMERYSTADLRVFSAEESARFLDRTIADPQRDATVAWELLYRLEPELHAEISYAEVMQGRLRAPIFRGLAAA